MLQPMRITAKASELGAATTKISTLQTKPEVFPQITQRAMTEVLGFYLPWCFLVQILDVLARFELLLPSLDLLLTRERICLHDSIQNCRNLTCCLVNINTALITANRRVIIVSIGFGFGCNGNLGDLCWRLVSAHDLSNPSDVHNQRMAPSKLVESRVLV